jgi:hypothetical protein
MVRRPRKGSLSKKTYFPNTGDQLENPEEGIIWECAKANKWRDPKTGTIYRYGLLVGRTPELADPILWAISSNDGSPWLDGIDTINRKNGAEELKRYEFNWETETWQEPG